MKNVDKYYLTIINSLFFIFPLSIILGNFSINLNIVLFCFFAIIFYNKKLIKFEINTLDKIILLLFFFSILSLIINISESYFNNETFPNFVISKTLLYLRYLILYLVVRILLSQKILKLDWFCIACVICATIVCLDIFIQFSFGKNVFGIEPSSTRHYSGVFGEELIAGGYLQRLAIFSFFLPFVLKKKFFHKISIQFFLFILFLYGIILSGNRVPLILFCFSFFIFLFLTNGYKKYFLTIFTIVSLFFVLNFNLNSAFENNSKNFLNSVNTLVDLFLKKELSTNVMLEMETTAGQGASGKPYISEFLCAQNAFKKNPFFGGGVRSYRTKMGCTTHPHNYYLEILVDLGLIGVGIILSFVFLLLYKLFIKKNKLFQFNLNLDTRVLPFFLYFIVEFFPIRTSGSFFSTSNAGLTFIILAILVSLISEKKTL